MSRKAIFSVGVGGNDVTGRISPHLTEITVHDSSGQTSDTATIILDDTDGAIRMPSKGDPISVALGWEGSGVAVVFDGMIDNVESSCGRGSGRLLTISAKSADTESKIKEPREKHW